VVFFVCGGFGLLWLWGGGGGFGVFVLGRVGGGFFGVFYWLGLPARRRGPMDGRRQRALLGGMYKESRTSEAIHNLLEKGRDLRAVTES